MALATVQHSQRHIPSCTGGTGCVLDRGHQVRRWPAPVGTESWQGESSFPAQWAARSRVPRCSWPGRARSHGALKSFPFFETKIICDKLRTSSC